MKKNIIMLMAILILFLFSGCNNSVSDEFESVETESFYITEPVEIVTESAHILIINDEFVIDTGNIINFKTMSDTEKEIISSFIELCNGKYESLIINKPVHDEYIDHFIMYYLDNDGYHVCALAEGISPRISESKNVPDMDKEEWFYEYFKQYKKEE